MNPYNFCKTQLQSWSACGPRKTAAGVVALVAVACLAYPVWRTLAAGGNLDTSFSGDGKYALLMEGVAGRSFPDVRIQSDPANPQNEKVVAIYSDTRYGGCGPDLGYDFYVTRLTTGGMKDSTFGNNGVKTINFNNQGTATALELQTNGKILVAGTTGYCTEGQVIKPVLARLTFDGALDTSFGVDGTVTGSGNGTVWDMILQPDGKIILVGSTRLFSSALGAYQTYSAIWRYNSNGTPDTTFSGNGLQILDAWPGQGEYQHFSSVLVEADGSIVVLAHLNAPHTYRLRRVSSNGTWLSSLNVDGAAGTFGYSIKRVGAKIWVIGSASSHGAIFSHNADGSLDTTFGGGTGQVTSPQTSWWTDVAVVPFTNKYVVVGTNYNSYPYAQKAVVTRYSSNGSLDTSFGTNGSTETTDFISGLDSTQETAIYNSVRVGLSGKIVASGQGGSTSGNPFINFGLIARYWGN